MGIRKDKAQHAAASFAMVLTGYTLWRSIYVVPIVFLIGLGKEIYDCMGYGVASWEDMAANIIGIAFAVMLIWWLEQKNKDRETTQ